MRAVFPKARIETEVIGEIEGLIPRGENEARRIVSQLSGANSAGLAPFGTKAGIFQSFGMDVVVCRPGSIEQALEADEFVSRDELGKCLNMQEQLAVRLAG